MNKLSKLNVAPAPRVAHLRIVLNDIKPVISRDIEVPTNISLADLHLVIQAAFEWVNYHLYDFEALGKVFDCEEPETVAATLDTVLSAGVERFIYRYDFGDNWRHTIMVCGFRVLSSNELLPKFLGGKNAAPPEDVGGVPGYQRFCEAVTSSRHREKGEYLRWYGGKFDPVVVDERRIDKRFSLLQALGIEEAWSDPDQFLSDNVQAKRWAERDRTTAKSKK